MKFLQPDLGPSHQFRGREESLNSDAVITIIYELWKDA